MKLSKIGIFIIIDEMERNYKEKYCCFWSKIRIIVISILSLQTLSIPFS